MRRFVPLLFMGRRSGQLVTANLVKRVAFPVLQVRYCATTIPPTAAAASTLQPQSSSASSRVEVDANHTVSILDASGKPVSVQPLEKFSDLRDTPSWLVEGLQRLAYPTTTDIQKYTIPVLEEGHDLIGLAPTGSGKTVAFAVPALKNMKMNEDGSPSILVLAPTRELVQQTTKVFAQLSGGAVRVCEAYGGIARQVQARQLHMGCDVIVACPGRLKDFLEGGDTSIEKVSFLVFDEADRLLDMGFKPQLDDILSYRDANKNVQTMMWSATWPSEVKDLARTYLSSGRIMIRAGTAGTGLQVNEHIRQHIIFAEGFRERISRLVGLIDDKTIDDEKDKLIIFVERQTDTEDVARALSEKLGIDAGYVGVIHGGLSQRQRDNVMYRFKGNQIRLLVATDVASRGLDIPDVTFVINFQAPKNIDSYCHRIGRTGRAGRTGQACTFVGRADGGIARELIDYLNKCKMEVPKELTKMSEEFQEERDSKRRSRFPQRGRNGGSGRWQQRDSRGFTSNNYNRNRRNYNAAHENRNSGSFRGGDRSQDPAGFRASDEWGSSHGW